MATVNDVCGFLDQFAPTALAEEWDNVGLLVGDPVVDVSCLMTCLTITPEVVEEAIEHNVDLIVAHHPLPFRPVKKITTESVATKMVWDLIRHGIGVCSPHTGFDSALDGINKNLATILGLKEVKPLVPDEANPEVGTARVGRPTQQTLGEFAEHAKSQFGLPTLKIVGDREQLIRKGAVACGSGGSFLGEAMRVGCDLFVTGEASFHDCLEARARGTGMVLLGHYHSERFALELLSETLKREFTSVQCHASERESDPISFV